MQRNIAQAFGKEAGTTMAEFAIVATLFFMMLFAIIEFGRLLYTHNALADAARRGARYASLHTSSATDKACVKNVVVYGETHLTGTCDSVQTGTPLIKNLTTANVNVVYDPADADNDPATPAVPYGLNIGTTTVTIQNFNFTLNIPFARQTLAMPAYRSTLTAESAGTP